jgi:SAM-dependent methyltransferase
MSIYVNPLYYEIAFSFFDAKKQIDAFETIIKKFSKIKVRRVLDIACGPSLQLREMAKRGYEALGLDLAPEMLKYLSEKAEEEGLKIQTVQADMSSFRLEKKVDFAFIMMGSLEFRSNDEFLSHLDSLSCSLRKGGLYFIQNKAVNWTTIAEQSWDSEGNGITVKTTYKTHWKDIVNQLFTEIIVLEVNDHGQEMTFKSEENLKFTFPQEFRTLIDLNGKFESLGWWEGSESTWLLDKPLEKAESPSNFNMILLRRK